MPSIAVSRRALLKGGAAAGFTLFAGRAAVKAAPGGGAPADFGVYLSIHSDNRVSVLTPNAEMGQGTYDALAKILADELEADWRLVEVGLSGADTGMVNPNLRGQLTGNSHAVRGYMPLLRQAGASARLMLRQAAAARFGVSIDDCMANDGHVTAGGQSLTYGALAQAAAQLPTPKDPPLKTPAQWTLIGKDLPRKETEPKINGTAIFGIDVAEPGMLTAALAMPAQLWGAPKLLDDGGVRARDGVKGIVPVLGGFAVVAEDFWTAKSAADAMSVGNDGGGDASDYAAVSTSDIVETVRTASTASDAKATLFKATSEGETLQASRTAAQTALHKTSKRFDLDYSMPMLAHGALEPLACTAKFEPGEKLTLWAPHQNPRNCFNLAAKMTGLAKQQIDVRRTFLGGGFGRKWNTDFVQQAIEVAMAFPSTPVKIIWTREQDTQHDFYRPAYAARITAGLDQKGDIAAWSSAVAGQSLSRTWYMYYKEGMPDNSLQKRPVYDLPTVHLESRAVDLPVPIGWWRSVAHAPLVFFVESAIDELARAAKADPLAYRLKHLTDERAIGALRALEQRLTPLAGKGRGRGYALSYGYDGYCAAAVDVTLDGKAVQVDAISAVFDCGLAIEPENVRRQIEGGILYGLGPALDGQVTIKDSAVKNMNLNDIGALSPFAVPKVDVHLLTNGQAPAGAGEAGTPVVAPALCNAIAAAGGPRVRHLPLSAADLTVTL